LEVEKQWFQSKPVETPISGNSAGDHGFRRIHAEITPPPRTGFEPAGPPFESGRLYGPKEGYFDKSWQLNDIELVQ
jgi:hypothetical protein